VGGGTCHGFVLRGVEEREGELDIVSSQSAGGSNGGRGGSTMVDGCFQECWLENTRLWSSPVSGNLSSTLPVMSAGCWVEFDIAVLISPARGHNDICNGKHDAFQVPTTSFAILYKVTFLIAWWCPPHSAHNRSRHWSLRLSWESRAS
jgi:hypothetical protein